MGSSMIDISLLAMLLAVHFSNNKDMQNFKMIVLALLISHVVFTTRKMYDNNDYIVESEDDDPDDPIDDIGDEINLEEVGLPVEDFQDGGAIDVNRDDFSLNSKAMSVGDSEFRRALTVPKNTIKFSTGRDVTKFYTDLAQSEL